jgi:hypothetical protein
MCLHRFLYKKWDEFLICYYEIQNCGSHYLVYHYAKLKFRWQRRNCRRISASKCGICFTSVTTHTCVRTHALTHTLIFTYRWSIKYFYYRLHALLIVVFMQLAAVNSYIQFTFHHMYESLTKISCQLMLTVLKKSYMVFLLNRFNGYNKTNNYLSFSSCRLPW